jgi:hypothetical protein
MAFPLVHGDLHLLSGISSLKNVSITFLMAYLVQNEIMTETD